MKYESRLFEVVGWKYKLGVVYNLVSRKIRKIKAKIKSVFESILRAVTQGLDIPNNLF